MHKVDEIFGQLWGSPLFGSRGEMEADMTLQNLAHRLFYLGRAAPESTALADRRKLDRRLEDRSTALATS
jgi:hypothetical protein